VDPRVRLWSVAGSIMSLLALACSMCGRTVDKAAVGCSSVFVRVVPACPIGKATNSTLPQYFLRAAMREKVFLGLLRELNFATEFFAKADLDDDEVAIFLVEGGRV